MKQFGFYEEPTEQGTSTQNGSPTTTRNSTTSVTEGNDQTTSDFLDAVPMETNENRETENSNNRPRQKRQGTNQGQGKTEENQMGESKGPGYCGSDEQKTKMAKNVLQVNVFFQTLNIQTITEDPKYEVKFV